MFINCPNCSALVATDLATDLPPERCPRCGFGPLVEEVELDIPEPGPGTEPEAEQAPAPGPAAPAGQEQPIPAAPAAPASTLTPTLEPEPTPEAEADPAPESGPDAAGPTLPAPATEPAPSGAGAEPAVAAAPERPAPGFLRRRGAASGGLDRRLVAIAAGLALLLVVQLLLADRARLAADAGWRPVVATLCGVLRCSLPPWREPAAIVVEQRDVRPVPGRPGVLRVSATIRNDARWDQAWPRLTLTLSDVDGRALGVRVFEPAEYLAAPPRDVTVASGESAAIGMEIVEPSPHAVAFNFRFD